MKKPIMWCSVGLLAISPPAFAQNVQISTYDADISVTSPWQDLAATYGAMSGVPAWVANKSAIPALVVFTDNPSPPSGGGTVLAANAPAVFGKGAHVWVRSLGGGSTLSIGLAAQVAPALAAGAASASNQAAVMSVPGVGAATAITVQGSSSGIAIPVSIVSGGSGSGSSGSIAATASASAPTYSGGSQPLSLDLYGALRTRIEDGADMALGATGDSAWAGSGTASAIALLKTIASAALDTTTVSTTAIDQTSPGIGNAIAPKGTVVSSDQAYTAGSWQPLNLTATGRLKIVSSSAASIAPAAISAATTSADLVACQYNAAVTLTSAQTAALQCDSAGRVKVSASVPNAATSTSSNVAAATVSTQLLAANANRLGGFIVNDSSVPMYVKFSSGASAASYDLFLGGAVNGVPWQTRLPDNWVGPIYAAWASATGTARVSERSQ